MRNVLFWLAVWWALSLPAADRVFKLSDYPVDETPPGFRSTITGAGKPGEWKVILDELPPTAETPAAQSSSVNRRAVLGQLAKDPTANHFPTLIYDKETFGDFKLSTQLKLVGGATERLAGIVFHFQNESNYFVAAANSLRGNLCCYRVIQGEIAPLFGVKTSISSGDWHTLGLQCEGNRVLFTFDDHDPIKLLVEGPSSGRIGFWTKSDSVAYFADTKINYTPREILAQALVRDALVEYPKLLDLKIFAVRAGSEQPSVIAGKNAAEFGEAGGTVEANVIHQGTAYYTRERTSAIVTAPLHDRNGEPIAAVRVVMKSFPGQTQDNAVVRAQPVIKLMQARVQSLEELLH